MFELPVDVQDPVSGFIYLVCPQLYFKGGPASVCKLHYRVDLIIAVVLVVQEIGSKGLRIDPEVTFAQSLEQKAERSQITDQALFSEVLGDCILIDSRLLDSLYIMLQSLYLKGFSVNYG